MKLILCSFIMAFFSIVSAEAEDAKDMVYKYKEYEVIDLGSMEIKGQIIAPGDLTVNERSRKIFERSLLEKSNFDYENKREIENLR